MALTCTLGKLRLFNVHTKPSPIIVDGKTIEEVGSYVYLGKKTARDGALLPKVKRRIMPGWAIFWKSS